MFEEFEEIEEYSLDINEDVFEDNIYLKDKASALKLIAMLLGSEECKSRNLSDVKVIEKKLRDEFLNIFSDVTFEGKALLQRRLENFSDKLLIELNKFQVLNHKNIVGFGGRFSAGKSKFINSILQANLDILPEDQNPTTSIPTYIIDSKIERFTALTTGGQIVELNNAAFQALTHKLYQKFKIGFSSFLECLIVEKRMPYRNIVFLDTPGYNKADKSSNINLQLRMSDEEVAYTQLRKVDYLIWVIDIENGGIVANDLEFISSLEIQSPILIVLNKSDKKSDNDIASIIKETFNIAQKATFNLFAVTAYSSRDNIEWNNQTYIKQFLNMAASNSATSVSDLQNELTCIEDEVTEKINNLENDLIKSRDELSEIISKNNLIIGIESLSLIYGDFVNELKAVRLAQKRYNNYLVDLKNRISKL